MARWELSDGATQVGPLEEDHVLRMLQSGVPPQTVVRAVGETEWRNPRSHAPFAIALEQARQVTAPGPPVQVAHYAAAPTQAHRVEKSEFVGMGCVVQGLGVVAPFFLPGIFWVLFGEKGAAVGLLLGLAAAIPCYLTGRKMAVAWTCGACGNRLTTREARVCPVCRAQLS